MRALAAAIEADVTPTKDLKKDDLVGYVASVAAEKAWASAALNLRLEMAVITEAEEPTGPDTSHAAGDAGECTEAEVEEKVFAEAA